MSNQNYLLSKWFPIWPLYPLKDFKIIKGLRKKNDFSLKIMLYFFSTFLPQDFNHKVKQSIKEIFVVYVHNEAVTCDMRHKQMSLYFQEGYSHDFTHEDQLNHEGYYSAFGNCCALSTVTDSESLREKKKISSK